MLHGPVDEDKSAVSNALLDFFLRDGLAVQHVGDNGRPRNHIDGSPIPLMEVLVMVESKRKG